MPEQPPKPPEKSAATELLKEKTRTLEHIKTLAREHIERNELFPFPGFAPGEYEKLKVSEEDFPGLATPIDDLVERFTREGCKLSLGKFPESGNVYVLPATSDDIENDTVLLRHLNAESNLPITKVLTLYCQHYSNLQKIRP